MLMLLDLYGKIEYPTQKQEKKLQQTALKIKPAVWKKELENRIPKKVYAGLESAFFKGFGLPDIVLFIGTLLKGIYETALNYGFDYESRWEQLLILKMMQAALSNGENWLQRNTEVEEMLESETVGISDDSFKQQITDTSSVFAMDMLLLKFIQGLPVVGVIGGAANPVYYSKVMKYVQLKYRKRYLWQKRHDPGEHYNVQKG